MGKHRSRLKILASILCIVSEKNGVNKTQIMYNAYLSYKLLVQYLNEVITSGLVICNDENCYKLTPKGQQFLNIFDEYSQANDYVKKQINHVELKKKVLENMCPNLN